MSNERDELAEVAYIAASPRAEVGAQRDWDYLQSRTLQAKERILAEQYRIADAILAAGYRKPRTITKTDELDALPDGTLIGYHGRIGRTQRHSISALDGGAVLVDKPKALPVTVLWEPTP